MNELLQARLLRFNATEATQQFLAAPKGHFIANEWLLDDPVTEILDPGTGDTLALVPEGNPTHVDHAVAAARDAFAGESGQRGRLRNGIFSCFDWLICWRLIARQLPRSKRSTRVRLFRVASR